MRDPMAIPISIRRLTSADIEQMRDMLLVLGKAFGELDTFTQKPPRSS